MFYYAVMSMSLQAGLVLAEQWRRDFSHISDRVEEIITQGPADNAIRILALMFPSNIYRNQGNDFFRKVFEAWSELNEPYWSLSDPRQYTFKSLLAAYQLGVSMLLDLFGYGNSESKENKPNYQKNEEMGQAKREEQIRAKQEDAECNQKEKDKHIRSDGTEAIEREKTTERRKQKRNIIRIAIVAVICVAFAVLVTRCVLKDIDNGKLRNFATETMSSEYSNVYADVVSIEPVYFVYEQKTSNSSSKIGQGFIKQVICECITVEGETIWASISNLAYPGGGLLKSESAYKPLTYSKSKPQRITGYVDTARQILPALEYRIGNVYVLIVASNSLSSNK